MNYIGIRCPVCGRPFAAGDDIVVCPECGAPYHRHCYEETGKCLFEEKHGTGEGWKPPAVQAPDTENQVRNKKCPYCGKMNAQSALFCDQCGQSLTGVPSRHARTSPYQNGWPQDNGPPPDPNAPQDGEPPQGFPFGGGTGSPIPGMQAPILLDPMGGVGPQEPIDGIPAGELAKLVQSNTPYYLPTFFRLKRLNRGRFNFCAFLFSGGWLLYRKLYKLGALVTGAMAVLYFLSTFISLNYTAPTLSKLYEQVGISMDVYPTYEQLLRISELLYVMDPKTIALFFLPLCLSAAQFLLMLALGIFGNRIYCDHCIRKIRQIRAGNPEPAEYDELLQSQGGVNIPLAVCLLISYSLIMYLPNFFI